MTLSWMAFGLVVGFLVAAGAWGLDGVCRIAGQPVRWVWAAALVLTVVLIGLAPARRVHLPVGSAEIAIFEPVHAFGSVPSLGVVAATVAAISHAVSATFAAAVERINRVAPASLGRYLAAAWIGLSAVLLALYALVLARFRRMQRGWPVVELCGVRVRLAPGGGPVVVGLSRAEIVVPRWLLGLGARDQQLVLAHETEHVRARDPLLLAIACAVAALVPWHPAVWWMLSRVRLGVELDCDVRVLRRGVPLRTYGELLVDLAGRSSGLPFAVPALAAKATHLKQRLIAMKTRHPRFARTRGTALALLAFGTLLAACAAKEPIAPAAPLVRTQSPTDSVHWTIPDMPGSMLVRADSTVRGARTSRGPAGEFRTVTDSRPREGNRVVDSLAARVPGVAPLFIVDGVRLNADEARTFKDRMDPGTIASVEVYKGTAATVYGPEAAGGVILITTKKAGGAVQ